MARCATHQAAQEIIAILNGLGPRNTDEEMERHKKAEDECYRRITARWPDGITRRLTKAGTDYVLNGSLEKLGLPTRPDANPKMVPVPQPGGPQNNGNGNNGQSRRNSDGNGRHPFSLEDLSSKGMRGWNTLSTAAAVAKDSLPNLRTAAVASLAHVLVAGPPRPRGASLLKPALVPRSEMPKAMLVRRSNTPPKVRGFRPHPKTDEPHLLTADSEYEDCIERWVSDPRPFFTVE
ncbi:MAG: hypothetical protein M1823_006105 [Watsoniomyces obsoletus]|nr:MAG: hypothetical protein M1823_006105 [Watsoniomyces obsoletus]